MSTEICLSFITNGKILPEANSWTLLCIPNDFATLFHLVWVLISDSNICWTSLNMSDVLSKLFWSFSSWGCSLVLTCSNLWYHEIGLILKHAFFKNRYWRICLTDLTLLVVHCCFDEKHSCWLGLHCHFQESVVNFAVWKILQEVVESAHKINTNSCSKTNIAGMWNSPAPVIGQ